MNAMFENKTAFFKLKNPRLLAELADTNRKLIAPLWLQLIQEGIADGSIKTDYVPQQI